MRLLYKSESGFTLIELLLYVSIVGSLLLAITLFFGLSVDTRIKNQSITEVNQQGTQVMEYMTQTIRNANSITAPVSGATGSTLTLVVPTNNLSPTTFNLSSGVLQVTEGSTMAVALTSGKVQLTNLTFKNLSRNATPGVVQVSFTLARVNNAGRNEYDYQKTFIDSAEVAW